MLTHLISANLSFSMLDRLSILDLLSWLYRTSNSSAMANESSSSKCERDVAWKPAGTFANKSPCPGSDSSEHFLFSESLWDSESVSLSESFDSQRAFFALRNFFGSPFRVSRFQRNRVLSLSHSHSHSLTLTTWNSGGNGLGLKRRSSF